MPDQPAPPWPQVTQQNADGTWTAARMVEPSRTLRVENWLRRHHLGWLAKVLAAVDERGLG